MRRSAGRCNVWFRGIDLLRDSDCAPARGRGESSAVGLTVLRVDVANPSRPKRTKAIDFLIDSGAIYSVVPAQVLKRLGIKPLAEEEFRLADGSVIVRRKGGALFQYGGRIGVADVIFGEKDDSILLGVLTLEALGLSLNPLKRELSPLPMILAGWQSSQL